MKIKIGIPRSIFYYYYKDIWKCFFDEFNIELIVSPNTNKKIMQDGIKYATDEMCLSMKNYIGHVSYLKDKCDYILIPRIDNYGRDDQTCTNYLALYDIINNMFDVKILNYDINLLKNKTELDGLINICKCLNIDIKKAYKAYEYATVRSKKENKYDYLLNLNKLNSNKLKILLVSHPYNTYDELIGMPLIKLLENMDIEIIYSDLLDPKITNNKSKCLSNMLYWKYSKESIGAISYLKDKIDGVVFLSTFPCGLDSLVNELVIRKLDIPYLNLIIDDLDSSVGFETRIESFIDILHQSIR